MQVMALRNEEVRAMSDHAIAHEYANYLVAVADVEEQYAESQRALMEGV